MFRDGSVEAAAESRFVHVRIGRDTQRPVPVPQCWQNRLAGLAFDIPAVPEAAAWT
nr:hypothetical protein [uncultured Lichenicoccus sp.]